MKEGSQMVLYVIVLIGLAWLTQSFFGYRQVRHFNNRFRELRKMGRVAIGRLTGKFRAGTVVLIAIDRRNMILHAERMQGVTVFSRLKPLPGLEGKNLLQLNEEDLSHYDRLTVKTIQNAVNNFKTVSKGGEVPTKKTWMDRLLGNH
jgi:glucitol operon activator protein